MSRKTIAVLCAAVLAAAAAGLAFASVPDGAGNIHVCMKRGGQLRVLDTDTGATCKSTELPLQWNIQPPAGQSGPQGPQGGVGPVGPKGPQGASGANGVTWDFNTMILKKSVTAQQLVGGWFATLSCPQGAKAASGGWEYTLIVGGKVPKVGEAYPSSDTSWAFAVEAGNDSIGTMATIFLNCVVAR